MSDIRHHPPAQVPQSDVSADDEEAPTGVISRITVDSPGPAESGDRQRAEHGPGQAHSGPGSSTPASHSAHSAYPDASTPLAAPPSLAAATPPPPSASPAEGPAGPNATGQGQIDKPPLPVRRPRRRGAARLGEMPDGLTAAPSEFDYFSTSRGRHADPPASSAHPAGTGAFGRPEPYGDWERDGPVTEIQSPIQSSQLHAPQWPDAAPGAAPSPAQWDPWSRTAGGPADHGGMAGRPGGRTGAAENAFPEGAPPLPAWVPATSWEDDGDRRDVAALRDVQEAATEVHGFQAFPGTPEPDPFGGRQSAREEGFGHRRTGGYAQDRRPEPAGLDHGRQPDPEPEPTPRPSRKRQRDPYLDNVKFLLIALVPLGHSLVPTLSASSARAAYLYIYVFHMPLFVIISGYLSRNFWNSNAKTNKLVDTFLVPYVIVEVGYALLRTALGQKWSLTIMDPAWLNWYLLALLFWRLSTPVWKRMRYPVTISVIVYLFAGFSKLSGDFSMDRFFGLMPFFVIGLVLKPEHFDYLRRRWVRVLSVLVLIGGAAVAIYLVKNYTVKLGPIYYKNSYAQLKLVWWEGMTLRIALLVAALALSASVLSLVPRRETWFSDLGTRTLYCYLLHGVPVLIAKEMGWLSVPWLYGPLGVAAIASASFALAIVLCMPITRTVFKWLLEPRLVWLYRRPRVQPSKDQQPQGEHSPAPDAQRPPQAAHPVAAPQARR